MFSITKCSAAEPSRETVALIMQRFLKPLPTCLHVCMRSHLSARHSPSFDPLPANVCLVITAQKLYVDVLGSLSLIVPTVSVDVKQH